MTYPIRVEGSAQKELADAVAWYEERRTGLGLELLHEIQQSVEILSRHPLIGRRVPFAPATLGVRRLLVRRFPFELVYRLRPDEIQIIAIAHIRREPGYWSRK